MAPALGKFTIARDRKVKFIQALTTRALVPLAKITNAAAQDENINKDMIMESALDATVVLSAISAQCNHVRRDIVKQRLGGKYKHLTSNLDPNAPKLLGDDITQRIKARKESSVLVNTGWMRPQPYGGGRFRGQYGPPRGRGFLGKRTLGWLLILLAIVTIHWHYNNFYVTFYH